jgi:hypothetical protein
LETDKEPIAVEDYYNPAWEFEYVDPDESHTYSHVSIKIDSHGDPHVVYFDEDIRLLKYAVKINDAWSTDFIDIDSTYTGDSIFRLDSDDRPHILAFSSFGMTLRHLTLVNDTWVSSNGTNVWKQASMALDQNNGLHISSHGSSILKYTTINSTDYFWEWVEEDVSSGWENSIVLDSKGNPHITYLNSITPNPYQFAMHAYKLDGQWNTEVIDNSETRMMISNVVIDSHDDLSLIIKKDNKFYIASKTDNSWDITPSDQINILDYDIHGKFTFLVDNSDKYHTLFKAKEGKIPYLKYVTWENDNWNSGKVVGNFHGFSVHSMDVYDDNTPYVCFLESFSTRLVVATKIS